MKTVFFIFAFCFFVNSEVRSEQIPPTGSWQAWLVALKTGAPQGLPGRPDGLALTATLPLWVDCHLSWMMDSPTEGKKLSSLSKKVILRSTAKDCEGQPEQWAKKRN